MHKRFALRYCAWVVMAALLAACQPVSRLSQQEAQLAPEPESRRTNNLDKRAKGARYAAVTANPYATQAAGRVLADGGTAVDAAIAAQMVLGLVEPQSSGLGGGGFMLVWDASKQRLHSYDGRETAPLSADETLFINPDSHEPMSFINAIIGGRSVGVPGMVKMLDAAHHSHGKLPWHNLFTEARQLSSDGFVVSERLHTLIEKVPALKVRPELAEYLFKNDAPRATGSVMKNADYALALAEIAEQGATAFYTGAVANHIVEVVNSDSNSGGLTLHDFSAYEAKEREPVCKWVFNFKVCGMGPPSSGAITVLSILGMMELAEAPGIITSVSQSVELAHFFIEASRLAFADRNTWLADPDFVEVPVAALLDTAYLRKRAMQITDKRSSSFAAGLPKGVAKNSFITTPSVELPSTTHLSIVDQYGNSVSMTTSIETAFGSRLMANGFILNNQLTDFSFAHENAQRMKIANRVEPGKRPLSSMSPMIVFDQNDQPVMVMGSPGGKSIIGFVARVLYETLALNRALAESINDKHIIDIGNALRIENGAAVELLQGLAEKGHQPKLRAMTSGLHAVQKTKNGWLGVADARREGAVIAQ